ncbi:MAG: hypothetical protein ACI9FB_001101 [Candidatus Azotimanducaceae bacterium]|jgi:hypothetical protein
MIGMSVIFFNILELTTVLFAGTSAFRNAILYTTVLFFQAMVGVQLQK